MDDGIESLPDDGEALKAALVAERGRRVVAETEAAFAKARNSDDQALIAHLKAGDLGLIASRPDKRASSAILGHRLVRKGP